jgi:hypothetical protein
LATSLALFPPLFSRVRDPRCPAKVVYPFAAVAFAGVLMFLCRLQARRQVGWLLRNRPSMEKFEALFGVYGVPHGDTLNHAFCGVEPGEVQEVVCMMTETLIRRKVLYGSRLMERYYVVAGDGTGTVSYSERHCPHCLTRTHNGKTQYYHNVLELKVVTQEGFVFSLMSEFIENEAENVSKQDCETKAFYRLARQLKERFPRLPISLSLDGLFARGPTFGLCEDLGWKYMIVLKDNDLPSVQEEFDALVELQSENRRTVHTGKDGAVEQRYRWVDDIAYVDSQGRQHIVSVVECIEIRPGKDGNPTIKKHMWVTNHKVTKTHVAALANEGGRLRWKIENEGFNVQKNGGYGLEHAYTKNPASAKVFYFLLQIAHMLAQLVDNGSLLRKIFPAGLGSAKNLAFRLLEAWRNGRISQADIEQIARLRFQIRFHFDSS